VRISGQLEEFYGCRETNAALTDALEAYKGVETDQSDEQSDATTGRKQPKQLFKAIAEQIFRAFPAIANLADKSDSGQITVRIEGTSQSGFDPSWLRNAVEEPLDEANVERSEKLSAM
jgi:hypothetical protein